jgi:hypothetical protein
LALRTCLHCPRCHQSTWADSGSDAYLSHHLAAATVKASFAARLSSSPRPGASNVTPRSAQLAAPSVIITIKRVKGQILDHRRQETCGRSHDAESCLSIAEQVPTPSAIAREITDSQMLTWLRRPKSRYWGQSGQGADFASPSPSPQKKRVAICARPGKRQPRGCPFGPRTWNKRPSK